MQGTLFDDYLFKLYVEPHWEIIGSALFKRCVGPQDVTLLATKGIEIDYFNR